MDENEESFILSVSASIFGLISVICCLYVCISLILDGYNPCCSKNKNCDSISITSISVNMRKEYGKLTDKNVVMVDVIFWMCVTDGLRALQMCITWIPQIFIDSNTWFYDNHGIVCKIISVIQNGVSIQSPLWHMLLAYHLFYLLKTNSVQSLTQNKKYHFGIIIIISLICVILPIPFIEYGQYYAIPNNLDCWLKDIAWQLIQATLISLCLLTHYTVMIYVYYKRKKHSNLESIQHYYDNIIKKYLRFIIIYSLIWIIPNIGKILEYIDNDDDNKYESFWLILMTHIGIGSTGIGNAIVWKCAHNNDNKIPYINLDDTGASPSILLN